MSYLQILLVLLLANLTFISCSQHTLHPKNDVELKFTKQINTGDKDSIEKSKAKEIVFDGTESYGSFEGDKGSVMDNYFMDQYFLQEHPFLLEFGHINEDPSSWEQRYEKKDLQANRHQGQVKWGDINGGYGEHHWDFNHHGHHDVDGGVNDEVDDEEGDNTHMNEEIDEVIGDGEEDLVKKSDNINKLVFNVATGFVIDRITGQKYKLLPVQ